MSTPPPEARAGSAASDRYDAITFSVVMSRFNSIADEMTLTMEKTAYTSILALGRDYSCAIYDEVPRQVCMFDAIPVHTNSLHLLLQEIARTFEGEIADGDIFLCNHPYRMNTHIGDLVTACPVFVDGRHMFWAVTRGHQQDVGAFIPSSMPALAKDTYQEGLLIPPLKIADRGVIRRDVIDLYLSNMRYPELLHGDLLAQFASIEKGRVRLVELAHEFGVEETRMYVDALIDYADRRMAQEIAAVPDGVYEGESWVDSDGADATDVPIRVKITIDGERAHVDFTGSGPQSPTGVNATVATLQAAASLPFLYYIEPDIPKNQGCIEHITAFAPEGTICNARFPASTTLATATPPNAMYDAINKAMAKALPERVFAGGARCNNMPDFSGVHPESGEPWGTMMFNNNGGMGACRGADGWPMFGSQSAMGGLKAPPLEQCELLYPIFIEAWELEPDSMGVGEWIGGPGNRLRVRAAAGAMECISFADGYRNPPHGIVGGTPGIGGGQFVENPGSGERRFVSGFGYFAVGEGEVWVGVSTGGGGYGEPLDRDVEQVRRDVRDGLISRERATQLFGVVLSDDWDPVVDERATAALRERMARRDSVAEPTQPGAATWLDANRRDGDRYLVNPLSAEVS